MRLAAFHRRSLIFHWRTNVAVVLGAAVGTAALGGALLVGDSMRGSLREVAIGRLGRVDHALVANRYVRETLASGLAAGDATIAEVAPVILLKGGATHADSQRHAGSVNVLGVDGRFWRMGSGRFALPPEVAGGRVIILNRSLADELGASPGDEVLIRVGKPAAVSTETLLGRRDDTGATLRLTVTSIVPADDLGAFDLNPRQASPRNAFVPLAALQRALGRVGRVNAVLVVTADPRDATPDVAMHALKKQLSESLSPSDLGLSFRVDGERGYFALESESLLVEPVVEERATGAASHMGLAVAPVLTYLANRITIADQGRVGERAGIPYSIVSAIDCAGPIAARLSSILTERPSELSNGEIWINQWAADDLRAGPGDSVALEYYVTGEFGKLETRLSRFTVTGVVGMDAAAGDPGFAPEYKGVTDTANLAEWDPPFPMDLKLIRDKDEAYWDRHRTAPKAFVSLADGERLWSDSAERFGRYTSIRFYPAAGSSVEEAAKAFEADFLRRIDPAVVGLSWSPLRAQMLRAAEGTTDFGMLFLGFSGFLIASAAMLVALLFRLGVEHRAGEVGLLLALGFSPKAAGRLFIAQGAVLAVVGGLIGTAGAATYAWLMLVGLRSWWSAAVNAPFLRLHVDGSSMVIGFAVGVLLAVGSMAWSLRGLTRLSAHQLLAGVVAGGPPTASRGGTLSRSVTVAAFIGAVAGIALPTAARVLAVTIGFFVSGAFTLVAGLSYFVWWLQREPTRAIHQPGAPAMARLAARSARRQRNRSLLTAGLIAAATFLIVALESFRFDPAVAGDQRNSATGGFALYAESAVPLIYDLNTVEGRRTLNMSEADGPAFDGVETVAFRLRPGDASSCTNLYRADEPRILGAGEAMIERGGFVFAGSAARTAEERANPWRLLRSELPGGAIPAIGDEAAVRWQLHRGLGMDLIVHDERGREVPLRFVALLKGSMLQDEIIIAERDFVRLFPATGGHGFFLVATPPQRAQAVEQMLERELTGFALDVGRTADRLAGYLAVQNTYISTFQMLGGFGLVLGTVGLAAVMLRNIWERRGELALMRALGFSSRALGGMVLAENVFLLLAGVGIGAVAAAVAVAPHVVERPGDMPWPSLGMMLLAVVAAGVVSGIAAVGPALRAPLIGGLRAE